MKNTDNFAPDLVEDIKYVGYFMYFCAAVAALYAYAIDYLYIADVLLCLFFGYRACNKPSKYLMACISVYYLLSIIMVFTDGNPGASGLAIKFFIMYWLGKTTFNAFKYSEQQLIPSNVS